MKWETLKLFDTHGREHPKGFAIYLMRGCDPTSVKPHAGTRRYAKVRENVDREVQA